MATELKDSVIHRMGDSVKIRNRAGLTALAVSALIVLTAPSALASTSSGTAEEVFVDSSYSQIQPEAPADGLTLHAGIEGNPYGCGGYTERVHKSGGMSSVHAGIKNCRYAPSYQIAGAEIMKKGWFGLWHRSAFMSGDATNRKQKLNVNAKAVCGNNSFQTYRGNGYHRVTIAGTNYIARTSSDIETRFACDS